MRNYIRVHASVLFVLLCVILGVMLCALAFNLINNSNQPVTLAATIGTIILQLSSTILAVGLTVIFFNLPDIKSFISDLITNILRGNHYVENLSDESLEKLKNKVIFEELKTKVKYVEPSLIKHLHEINKGILSAPYRTNFIYDVSVIEYLDTKDLVIENSNIRYRIHVEHLARVPYQFTVKKELEWRIEKDRKITKENWLRNCTVKIGKQICGIDSWKISSQEVEGQIVFHAIFEKCVEIDEDIDVEIIFEALNSIYDPLDVTIAALPTKGFRINYHFKPGYSYDATLFTAVSPEKAAYDQGSIQARKDGIILSTDDWVLPGDGGVINYTQ